MILCLRSPVVGVVCRLNHKNRTMNIKKLLEEINEQDGERPDCYDFAMDFLGEPECSKIDAYVKSLENQMRMHRLQEAISPQERNLMTQSELNQISARLATLLSEVREKYPHLQDGLSGFYPYIAIYSSGQIALYARDIFISAKKLPDFWAQCDEKLSVDPRKAEIENLKARIAELEGGAQ